MVNEDFIKNRPAVLKKVLEVAVRAWKYVLDGHEDEAITLFARLTEHTRTEPGCRNLGRMILRHADAGGRPIDNAEFCLAYGRARVERDRTAGIRIYDNRENEKADARTRAWTDRSASWRSRFRWHSRASLLPAPMLPERSIRR